MKRCLILICIFLSPLALSPLAAADELNDAYQKEYAYLLAEKDAVSQRLSALKSRNSGSLVRLKSEIKAREQQYLGHQNRVERLNQRIVEAERNSDTVEGDSQLLNTTLLQATESLTVFNKDMNEEASLPEQLAQAFEIAGTVLSNDASVIREKASFFQQDGRSVEGEALKVGRIARFGVSESATGPLYPSGNGRFSLWENFSNPNSEKIANGEVTDSIDIFLYDNANKAIEKSDEKKFMDDVKAGGLVGKVILALGALGLLLVVLRMLFLFVFSSNVHRVAKKVDAAMSSEDPTQELTKFERGKGSAHRVIAKTIKHLDKDRDHIEDIVSESILHERGRIDRFRSIILVLAAISPLLGLLGTVTGMITTFDIITEFGTGDPKLLSSGISEALITTKFGLIVAIPLLLLGNVLSSWGGRIKNDLEQAALYVINTHKV